MVSDIRTPWCGMVMYLPLYTLLVVHMTWNRMGFYSCFEDMQGQDHIPHQFRIQHYHELKDINIGLQNSFLHDGHFDAKNVSFIHMQFYLVGN